MTKTRLADICQKITSTIKQSDVLADAHGYPVYGASGLVGYLPTYQFDSSYVAVVKDGAGIGKTMCLPARSSILNTLQGLLPESNINTRYLYYLISSMNLKRYQSGSTIPHIYFRDYGVVPIISHDYETQLHISTKLDLIEKCIHSYQQMSLRTNQLIKSRFASEVAA